MSRLAFSTTLVSCPNPSPWPCLPALSTQDLSSAADHKGSGLVQGRPGILRPPLTFPTALPSPLSWAMAGPPCWGEAVRGWLPRSIAALFSSWWRWPGWPLFFDSTARTPAPPFDFGLLQAGEHGWPQLALLSTLVTQLQLGSREKLWRALEPCVGVPELQHWTSRLEAGAPLPLPAPLPGTEQET